MLNISNNNKINENIEKYSTYKNLSERPHYKILNKIITKIDIKNYLDNTLPGNDRLLAQKLTQVDLNEVQYG
jgi:hypothetical protein